MTDNFEKAINLAKQQKFKKALPIIKKVNLKAASVTFKSMELEALCLFNLKSYPMARIKMEKALAIASNNNERLTTFKNLAAIYIKLELLELALNALQQLVELDKQYSFIGSRLSLLEVALELGQHEIIKQYAPTFIKFREISMGVLLSIVKSSLLTADKSAALTYLGMAEAAIRANDELKARDKLNISMLQIVNVLDGYHQLKEYKKEANLLNFLSKSYQEHTWFKTTQNRLEQTKVKSSQTEPEFTKSPNQRRKNPRVTGQDPKVIKIIEELLKDLENMGAEFHSGLQITETNGNLSVSCSDPISHKERLMHVPLKCMPLLCDYKFELSPEHQLIITAKKNALNPAAHHIMKRVVALYNATNKFFWWKNHYPLFLLSGQKTLVDKLMQAKSHNVKYRVLYAEAADKVSAEALIQSFFGSRSFSFSKENMRKVGIKMKNPREQGLIPIIELINHDVQAQPFLYDQGCQFLDTFITNGPENQEVFVQYNLDDPLLTFLQYGFVDPNAPWIYSVPITINTLTGKRIYIQSVLGSELPTNLPDNLKAIHQYVPQQCTRQGDDIYFSSLIIPSKNNTHNFSNILSYLLTKIDNERHYANKENLKLELDNVMHQLVESNIKYWQDLLDLVNSTEKQDKSLNESAAEQLRLLCITCQQHLKGFAEQTGHYLRF